MTASGSGIAVYSLLWVSTNASFVLDGGPSKLYIHDDSCYHTTPAGCYNIETFAVQFLRNDNHVLDITLLDYNGGASNFVFDYAVVNETTSVGTPIASPAAVVTVYASRFVSF
jgi:hypothetical protein